MNDSSGFLKYCIKSHLNIHIAASLQFNEQKLYYCVTLKGFETGKLKAFGELEIVKLKPPSAILNLRTVLTFKFLMVIERVLNGLDALNCFFIAALKQDQNALLKPLDGL